MDVCTTTFIACTSRRLSCVVVHIDQGCKEISSSARVVAPLEDVASACATYGTAPNRPEQLLYEAYVSGLGAVHGHSERVGSMHWLCVCVFDPRRRTLAMGWMKTDGEMASIERFMSTMMTFRDKLKCRVVSEGSMNGGV